MGRESNPMKYLITLLTLLTLVGCTAPTEPDCISMRDTANVYVSDAGWKIVPTIHDCGSYIDTTYETIE